MPDTRASNPTSSGPSLLDKSTARPADVDMAIFEKNQAQSGSATSGGSQKSQGAVNSNYLEECRRDNPSPADEKTAKRTVTLSDCRIDTPQEDLATDQPFKMSCIATSSDGKPVTSGVTFRLYCTLPDGTEEDTGLAKVGKREGDRICAEGTLYSPKKLVEWGEMLKYRVVAEQGGAAEKDKSRDVNVVGYMPPNPVAVWELSDDCFESRTSFILPKAREVFYEIEKVNVIQRGWKIAIIGLGDSILAGRRAYATQCFLSNESDKYEKEIITPEGNLQWHEFVALKMIDHLEKVNVSINFAEEVCSKYIYSISKSFFDDQIYIKSPYTATPSCSICSDERDKVTHDLVSASTSLPSTTGPSKNRIDAKVFVVAFTQLPNTILIPCIPWQFGSARCYLQQSGHSGSVQTESTPTQQKCKLLNRITNTAAKNQGCHND